jgi:hypothetical protein
MDAAPGPAPAAAPAPKGSDKFFITLILVAFIILAVAVVAEVYYLATHAETRCRLLNCQQVEQISSNIDRVQSLSQARVDEIKRFLDRLTPEKQQANLFNQAQFTLTAEGFVLSAGPDIFESTQGDKFIYQLVLQAENLQELRYRFTQKEMEILKVKVVTYDGMSFPATINDLKEGDTLVIRMVYDFLDTRTGDSIDLEIVREKF